jgi:hypothetical protein
MEGDTAATITGESGFISVDLLRREFQAEDFNVLKQALATATDAGISRDDPRYQALVTLSDQLMSSTGGARPVESQPADRNAGREERKEKREALQASLSVQQIRRLAAQKAALALISKDVGLPAVVERALVAGTSRGTGNAVAQGVQESGLNKGSGAPTALMSSGINAPLLQAVRDSGPASLPIRALRQAREERFQQRLKWRKETLERLPVAASQVMKRKAAVELQALKVHALLDLFSLK